MNKSFNLLVLVSFFGSSLLLELPADLKKCKRAGEDFNGCLKEAIQDALPKFKNGYPDLKIPPFDPAKVEKLTIGEGTKGAVQFVQYYTDVKLHNLSSTKIDKVKAVITPKEFSLDIYGVVPQYTLDTEYEFKGQILALPLVGKGHMNAISTNTGIQVSVKAVPYEKKEKTFGKVKNVSLNLTMVDLKMDFTNFFDGNEVLGAEMKKFFNENWKVLWEDVGSGYELAYATILQQHISRLFDKVSLDEMFPL